MASLAISKVKDHNSRALNFRNRISAKPSLSYDFQDNKDLRHEDLTSLRVLARQVDLPMLFNIRLQA